MEKCVCGKPYYPESTNEGPCHFKCQVCGSMVRYDEAKWYQVESGCCEECFNELEPVKAFSAMAVSLLPEIYKFTKNTGSINPRLHLLLTRIEETINRVKEWF